MLEQIIKINVGEYILNDTVCVKINKDSTLTISYDEEILTNDEVHQLIYEFFEI